ncbi:MAG: hypothetical protein NTY30_00585 [Candidatus Berkelbacteria bacterium]|nr:hypothetical protein [Candidatus Berkelbacteria bacterium]
MYNDICDFGCSDAVQDIAFVGNTYIDVADFRIATETRGGIPYKTEVRARYFPEVAGRVRVVDAVLMRFTWESFYKTHTVKQALNSQWPDILAEMLTASLPVRIEEEAEKYRKNRDILLQGFDKWMKREKGIDLSDDRSEP